MLGALQGQGFQQVNLQVTVLLVFRMFLRASQHNVPPILCDSNPV